MKSMEPIAKSGKEVEAKSLMRNFSLDVFVNCVFGIKCDALTNPDSEIKKVVEKLIGGEEGFSSK